MKLTAVLKARLCSTADMALRIERQHVLKPLQRIERHEAGEAEQQHRDRIGHPVLLLLLVDAAEPIDAALDRTAAPATERCARR